MRRNTIDIAPLLATAAQNRPLLRRWLKGMKFSVAGLYDRLATGRVNEVLAWFEISRSCAIITLKMSVVKPSLSNFMLRPP